MRIRTNRVNTRQTTSAQPNVEKLVKDLKADVKEWKICCYKKAWGDRPPMPILSQLWTYKALKKHGLMMIAVLRECGKAEQV